MKSTFTIEQPVEKFIAYAKARGYEENLNVEVDEEYTEGEETNTRKVWKLVPNPETPELYAVRYAKDIMEKDFKLVYSQSAEVQSALEQVEMARRQIEAQVDAVVGSMIQVEIN